MTLESRINKNRYIGNGATTQFPFTFKIWKTDQILVYVGDGESEQEVSTQCTVTLTASGGTVTFPTAPASGTIIVFKRNMPYIQEDDYRNGTRFDSEEIEDRFDQDCAERQDLAYDLSRAIVPPQTSAKTGAQLWQEMNAARQAALDAAGEAHSAVTWLHDFVSDVPEGDISLNSAIAWGASESRTLAERFADVINVKDYGAKGDGVTDDSVAITAAVAVGVEKDVRVHFPAGTYIVNSNIDSFLSVSKTGDGILVRNEYQFTVCPKSNEENTIYVAPDGLVTNDGLSTDNPTTIANAVNSLKMVSTDKGQWIVKFLAGDYTDNGVRLDHVPTFNYPVIFAGEVQTQPVQTGTEFSNKNIYYTDEDCTQKYEYNEASWEDDIVSGLYTLHRLSRWDGSNSSELYAFRRDESSSGYGVFKFQDLYFKNWKKTGFENNSGCIVLDSCDTTQYRNYYSNCGVAEWLRYGFSRSYLCHFSNCITGGRYQYSQSGTVGSTGLGCVFSDCTETGMHVGRASVMHCDYNAFVNNKININVTFVSRCVLVSSVFVSWTMSCFFMQHFSMVTNAESCTFQQDVNGKKPISYTDQHGLLDSLPLTNSFALNTFAFPSNASLVLNGTTDKTFLTNADYERLATLNRRSFEVLGTNNSYLMFKVHIRFSDSGTGGDKLEITVGGSTESTSLKEVTLPSGGSSAGWLHFMYIQHGVGSSATGVAEVKWLHEPSGSDNVKALYSGSVSSTNISQVFAGKSLDNVILRLYGTLSNASNTLIISGWYTEINRG